MLKPLIIYTENLKYWEGLIEAIKYFDDIRYHIVSDIEELYALAEKHNNPILLFLTKRLIDLTEVGWLWGAFGHRVETIIISRSKIDEDVRQRARFFGIMRLIEGVPEWDKLAEDLNQVCFSANWFTAPLSRMPVAKAIKMLRTRKKTSMMFIKQTSNTDMPVSKDGKILPDPDTGIKMPAGLGRIYILKGFPFFVETSKELGIDAIEIITSLKTGIICISEWFISPNTVNITDAMLEEVEEIIEYKAKLYESSDSRKIELDKFASQQSILDKIRLPKEFINDVVEEIKFAEPVDAASVNSTIGNVPTYARYDVQNSLNDANPAISQPSNNMPNEPSINEINSALALKNAIKEQKKYGHHKISDKRAKISKAPKISNFTNGNKVIDLDNINLQAPAEVQDEDTKVKISEMFTDFKDALNQINVSNVKIDDNDDDKSDSLDDISSKPTRRISVNNPDYYCTKLQISDVLQQSSKISLDTILLKFEKDDSVIGSSIVGPTGAIWVSKFDGSIDEVNIGLVSSDYIQSTTSLIKELYGDDSIGWIDNSNNINKITLESDEGTGFFRITKVRGSYLLVITKKDGDFEIVNRKITETLLDIEHIII